MTKIAENLKGSLFLVILTLWFAADPVHGQAVKGAPAKDAPSPPVTYMGLIPGVSTVAAVREKLGAPAHEAAWYAWKMLYAARGIAGQFDSIHLQSSRPDKGNVGNIEAFTIPAGYETESAVRAKLGAPEFYIEFSRESMADYSERGVRFVFARDGRTIGVAYFPHGHRRVHSGERKRLSLRGLRQGAQAASRSVVQADLRCGAGQADLSPVKEEWFGPNASFVIHDPLRARAAVFAQGETKIALVGGDIFGMLKSEIDPIEARLKKDAGISLLVLAMSHNHTAGDPVGIYGFYPKDYVKHIQDGVYKSVMQAVKNLKKVRELRVASDELSLAGARVAGLIRNARNPGIVDPQIAAVQAIDASGKPIVTVAHFACHVEGVKTPKGKPLEVTADFPGYLCDRLLKLTGAPAVFLNGAVGGMVSGDTRARTHAEAKIAGERFADEIQRIVQTAHVTDPKISFRRQRIEIPVTNPRMRLFMKMSADRRPIHRGRLASEMFHIRLGEAELLTIPGEILPELSFEILARMRGFPRLIIGIANDELGYIIPGYDFRDDAYEESMSLGPAAGPIVLRHALRLVEGEG